MQIHSLFARVKQTCEIAGNLSLNLNVAAAAAVITADEPGSPTTEVEIIGEVMLWITGDDINIPAGSC